MKKRLIRLSVLFILLMLPVAVFAADPVGTMSISGATLNTNGTTTLTIAASSSQGKVAGGDGTVSSSNPSCVSVTNVTSPMGSSPSFLSMDTQGNGLSQLGTVSIKAGTSSCETTLTISGASIQVQTSAGMRESRNLSFTSGTIIVNAPKDSDSRLKSLSVAGYSLSPSFSSGTKSYTVNVPEGTESVSISAEANSSKAKSVTGTGTKTLTGDTSSFNVVCTAENGSSTTYTVTVKRAKKEEPTPQPQPQPEPAKKSSDSSLKYLSVSGYTLSPSFRSGTTEYSMTVGNGVTGLYVQATPNDPKATYVISGDDHWDVGRNTINITVTAEDGSKTTYKVYVTRESAKVKSSDKNVDFRINNAHTITPAFTNNNNNYEVTVPYDVTKLDLSVIPYDKNASVKISGNDKLSSENKNVVTIIVTAEDGSSKTITLNVTRSPYKANTDLLDLKVKGYEISPKFKPSKVKYKVTVPYKVKKVKVLVKAPKDATYKITGYKNLQVGKNIVLVKVTDKKGFVKYYQIDVTRKEGFKKYIPFLIILFLLLLLLLLLFLLLKRRKEKEKRRRRAAMVAKEEHEDNDTVNQSSPVNIEFKPEFNFGSKNGTDDDVVYSSGDMLNGPDVQRLQKPKEGKVIDAEYDPYDDVVTKDELVDALNEGIRTKNVDKLQMLLDQENLNRKKEKLKKREESSKDVDDDDYEPHHSSDDYDE